MNGFVLRERDDPAFSDDVKAWKYGPVIPSVYIAYKQWGDRPISKLYLCQTSLDDTDKMEGRWTRLAEIIGRDVAAIASGVLKQYGKYNGSQLVSMTHGNDTPWKKAYRPWRNNIISTHTIKQFYRNLSADDRGR